MKADAMTGVTEPWSVRQITWYLAIALAVFGLDQITKVAARDFLELHAALPVTPFFNLTLNYNPGVTFGLFAARAPLEAALLLVFTAVVLLAVLVWIVFAGSFTERLGFSLILAGGVSNLVDRYQNGAVTDFIDLHARGWHWPTFNVADIAIVCGVALLLLTLVISPRSSVAHEFTAGALKVDHPWSRATPGGAKVAAGYLRITNTGTEPDRLLGGRFEIADGFEMHQTSLEEGIARMRELMGGIPVPAGETITFEPGRTHIMFTNLRRPLVAGERITGTLRFEKAGEVRVEFTVEKMGGQPDHQAHGSGSAAE